MRLTTRYLLLEFTRLGLSRLERDPLFLEFLLGSGLDLCMHGDHLHNVSGRQIGESAARKFPAMLLLGGGFL